MKKDFSATMLFASFCLAFPAMQACGAAISTNGADFATENGTIDGEDAAWAVSANGGYTLTITDSTIDIRGGQNDRSTGAVVAQTADANEDTSKLSTVIIGSEDALPETVVINGTGFGVLAGQADNTDAYSPGNVEVYGKSIQIASTNNTGVRSGDGSHVRIGSEGTESVTIQGSDYGLSANLGQIDITGKSVAISSNQFAVHVGNSTEDATPQGGAYLKINADKTVLTGVYGGIQNFSNGRIDISGDLEINGTYAIYVRGNSITNINEDGQGDVVINGEIQFALGTDNTGEELDAVVNVNLNGANSAWNGNVSYDVGGVQTDKKVTGLHVTLSDGAQWNPTEIISGNETRQALNHLTMNDGVINLLNSSQTIEVESLDGSSGTVNLPTVINKDGSYATGKLIIDTGSASSTILHANAVGITADDAAADAAKAMEAMASAVSYSGETQTYIAEGDVAGAITASVKNGQVVEGTQRQADNTKLTAFEGVNAVTLVEWRNQINHLTKRMGDLRQNAGDIGAWARVYGGEYKWHDATVDTKSTTVQVGGDGRLGDWIVGGAFSYTDSSIDLSNGDGDGDMYSFAVYGSRYFDCGAFLDLTARYGYIKNDIEAGNMAIDTKSNAFGVSAEVGHHFMFLERAYIEPQLELAYGYAEGDSATASNGVKIDQDDYQSLVGRIGFRTGFDFPEKAGTLYAHASYSYDFLGDAEGIASKDGVRAKLDEDLGGGWFSYGIGGQFAIGQNAYAYGEVERSTGGDVENPWQFNIGVRLMF